MSTSFATVSATLADHSWRQVKVIAKQHEAQDIVSFELVDPHGHDLPAFSAGAHIDVQINVGLVRQYSLCDAPSERHRYVIAVLKDAQSRGGSMAMHERIAVGDLIRISEPKNHFPLASGARKILLFAGGIGVTPMLCMAEQLSQSGVIFELHYCSRSAERMAFRERITHSAFAAQAHFHFDDGDEQQKLHLQQHIGNPAADVHLYVCGPTGFMTWVLGNAQQYGWPEAQVHREFFAAAAPSHVGDQEFTVTLASSGATYRVSATQSIVEVLCEQGIDIPTSCEQGVCGTCLTRLLAGEPDHRDSFLTDEERHRNDQILPCCSRAKSSTLILDL